MGRMLTIRLQRVGRVNEPKFRVVLTDSKNGPKSGKTLEILGAYDSRPGKDADNKLNGERIKYWISKGAKPSETMHNMLVGKKIIAGKKVNVLPKKSPIKKDVPAEAGKPATPAPAAAPTA